MRKEQSSDLLVKRLASGAAYARTIHENYWCACAVSRRAVSTVIVSGESQTQRRLRIGL